MGCILSSTFVPFKCSLLAANSGCRKEEAICCLKDAAPLQVLSSDCALSLLFVFCCLSSMWILGRLPGSNVPFLRKVPLGGQDPALPVLQIPQSLLLRGGNHSIFIFSESKIYRHEHYFYC